jgi:hypothetical protein
MGRTEDTEDTEGWESWGPARRGFSGLGILESASIRSVISRMLREIGGRSPVVRRGLLLVLKVELNLRKGECMEIVKAVPDLPSILVFFGIAITPGAILTSFALRGNEN